VTASRGVDQDVDPAMAICDVAHRGFDGSFKTSSLGSPCGIHPAAVPMHRGGLAALEGVITRPVRGLSSSQLALAWRTGDHRPLVVDYARACLQAARFHLGPACPGPVPTTSPPPALGLHGQSGVQYHWPRSGITLISCVCRLGANRG
jgi:hypothetical protein